MYLVPSLLPIPRLSVSGLVGAPAWGFLSFLVRKVPFPPSGFFPSSFLCSGRPFFGRFSRVLVSPSFSPFSLERGGFSGLIFFRFQTFLKVSLISFENSSFLKLVISSR